MTWLLIAGLFIAPFIYGPIRERLQGTSVFPVDQLLVTLGCWAVAVGILIGKVL